MEILLSATVGVLVAGGVYLLLRRSILKVALGVSLLGHAANLLVFTVGRLAQGGPPIIDAGARQLPPTSADPVPHALVLTAIVIGFGLQAFMLALVRRLARAAGTDDGDALALTEQEEA